MNLEFFIAKRLVLDKENKKEFSRSFIKIALFGISLSLTVMLVTVSIATAFKEEIRNKVIGFGAHVQIINYDSNTSFETKPVSKKQDFKPALNDMPGIGHVQVFATKAGIMKAGEEIQGTVIKGVGTDFDWSFFKRNLKEGEILSITDSVYNNGIIVSQYMANMLALSVGDDIALYFIQDPPRVRRFTVKGIYETGLQDFDKLYSVADIKHVQRLNDWDKDQVSGFEIFVDDFDQLEEMTFIVNDIVGYDYTEEGEPLRVTNIVREYPQIFDWIGLFNLNVIIIIMLMLVVAGINMVSGLLVMILERSRMIGILKAVGAENMKIRKVFLYMSSFLILAGLFWGNIIGLGLLWIQDYFKILKLDPTAYFLSTIPVKFNLIHVLLINAGTLITVLLILVIPSYLISRVSPVKTIQFD
ncbi:MAG: ABC transporter permease [Bacteroidales bacterium]